jgi:hypothetical protein
MYSRCHVFLERTDPEKSRTTPKRLSEMVDLNNQSSDPSIIRGFATRIIFSTAGDQDLPSKYFS